MTELNTMSSLKPIVIGLYGVSGAGKTHLLNNVKDNYVGEKPVRFYDGSSLIEAVVPGGLTDFKQAGKVQQAEFREKAMLHVIEEAETAQVAIVIAGHHLFWEDEQSDEPETISTKKDRETYTHIIYYHVDPELIATRRSKDDERRRQPLSVEHLAKWQKAEISELRKMCLDHGILFTVINAKGLPHDVELSFPLSTMIDDFQTKSEMQNEAVIAKELKALLNRHPDIETMLVLDGDKTLAPNDTGDMFWCNTDISTMRDLGPLHKLFKIQGYTYQSFRQAALLYEEKSAEYNNICHSISDDVKMHVEMLKLLQRAWKFPHVGLIVVTCGLKQVWEKVLRNHGLGDIPVIGSGPLANGYVVTDKTKGNIIDLLHKRHIRTIAFGDGPLDIEMFRRADQSYVVVGAEDQRSKSMDKALSSLLTQTPCLDIHQILCPDSVLLRLDATRLPNITITAALSKILKSNTVRTRIQHATHKPVAKLLMTPMRDACLSGPALRDAHHKTATYLAEEYLSGIIGLETYPVSHVQGGTTDGYRFAAQEKTLIVPLMRGGEPMAFGVHELMPLAAFAHAKEFTDLNPAHFTDTETIILVDSVINSGASIMEFVKFLRKILSTVRIIVVAGVVQEKALVEGDFAKMLRNDDKLWLVALRTSENKFKGQGETDTGDRLFNTTYL